MSIYNSTHHPTKDDSVSPVLLMHLPTQTTPFVTALLLFEHSTITSTSSTVTMTTKKADGMDATTATGNEATAFDDVIVLDGRKVGGP